MKKLFCILFLSLFLLHSHAQTTDTKIYNPSANAENDISALVKLARIEHKHVLLRRRKLVQLVYRVQSFYTCRQFDRFFAQ